MSDVCYDNGTSHEEDQVVTQQPVVVAPPEATPATPALSPGAPSQGADAYAHIDAAPSSLGDIYDTRSAIEKRRDKMAEDPNMIALAAITGGTGPVATDGDAHNGHEAHEGYGEHGEGLTPLGAGGMGSSMMGVMLEEAAHGMHSGSVGAAGGAFGAAAAAVDGVEGVEEMMHAKNNGDRVHAGLKLAAAGGEAGGFFASLAGFGASAGLATGVGAAGFLGSLGPVGAGLGIGVAIGDAIAPHVFSGPNEQKDAADQSRGSTGNSVVDSVFGVGKSTDPNEGKLTSAADLKATSNAITATLRQAQEAKAAGDEQAAQELAAQAMAHMEQLKKEQDYIRENPIKAALSSIF